MCVRQRLLLSDDCVLTHICAINMSVAVSQFSHCYFYSGMRKKKVGHYFLSYPRTFLCWRDESTHSNRLVRLFWLLLTCNSRADGSRRLVQCVTGCLCLYFLWIINQLSPWLELNLHQHISTLSRTWLFAISYKQVKSLVFKTSLWLVVASGV